MEDKRRGMTQAEIDQKRLARKRAKWEANNPSKRGNGKPREYSAGYDAWDLISRFGRDLTHMRGEKLRAYLEASNDSLWLRLDKSLRTKEKYVEWLDGFRKFAIQTAEHQRIDKAFIKTTACYNYGHQPVVQSMLAHAANEMTDLHRVHASVKEWRRDRRARYHAENPRQVDPAGSDIPAAAEQGRDATAEKTTST